MPFTLADVMTLITPAPMPKGYQAMGPGFHRAAERREAARQFDVEQERLRQAADAGAQSDQAAFLERQRHNMAMEQARQQEAEMQMRSKDYAAELEAMRAELAGDPELAERIRSYQYVQPEREIAPPPPPPTANEAGGAEVGFTEIPSRGAEQSEIPELGPPGFSIGTIGAETAGMRTGGSPIQMRREQETLDLAKSALGTLPPGTLTPEQEQTFLAQSVDLLRTNEYDTAATAKQVLQTARTIGNQRAHGRQGVRGKASAGAGYAKLKPSERRGWQTDERLRFNEHIHQAKIGEMKKGIEDLKKSLKVFASRDWTDTNAQRMAVKAMISAVESGRVSNQDFMQAMGGEGAWAQIRQAYYETVKGAASGGLGTLDPEVLPRLARAAQLTYDSLLNRYKDSFEEDYEVYQSHLQEAEAYRGVDPSYAAEKLERARARSDMIRNHYHPDLRKGRAGVEPLGQGKTRGDQEAARELYGQ